MKTPNEVLFEELQCCCTSKLNPGNASIKMLDFSYDSEKKGLLINLPNEWREGYLQLTANTQNLAPFDFTLMTNKALPSDALVCENDYCSIIWKNYQVDIIRQDGNNDARWWLNLFVSVYQFFLLALLR